MERGGGGIHLPCPHEIFRCSAAADAQIRRRRYLWVVGIEKMEEWWVWKKERKKKGRWKERGLPQSEVRAGEKHIKCMRRGGFSLLTQLPLCIRIYLFVCSVRITRRKTTTLLFLSTLTPLHFSPNEKNAYHWRKERKILSTLFPSDWPDGWINFSPLLPPFSQLFRECGKKEISFLFFLFPREDMSQMDSGKWGGGRG